MTQTPLYGARYRLLHTVPDDLWAGETLLLVVEITNTGTAPWLHFGQHPVRLSYHWRDPAGHTVVHDGLRGFLKESVPPGESTVVELRVDSPPDAGDYTLEIDLLEEGMAWFSERNVPPLAVPIAYLPNNAPRATVINGNCVINDAVGRHIVDQVQVLRKAGYHVLFLTEHLDERLPADFRRSSVMLRLADLAQPDPRTKQAVEHFFSSEVVIVHYSTYYELAQAIKLARNSAIIFDYHGVTPPQLWDPNAPGYSDLVRGQEYLSLVQHADYAIGHSEFTRGELVATGLIAPARTTVMPYAVVEQVSHPAPPDESLIEHYGLHGKRVLLYVGRISRNKRISDLVEALPLIRKTHPDTVLLLVGDNQSSPYRPYAAELTDRARSLGCEDAVIFTGPVREVAPFYDLCDIFVTASVHEGFCMPVVEAMARGKPVVAARATALPETVGRAGLFFEPFDIQGLTAQVTRLLDDLQTSHESLEALLSRPLTDDDQKRLHRGTIGLVAPRYGLDILGGAERHIRGWAEHLAARGYPVEVLTTCTASMASWTNDYPPGIEVINGVTVRRFATDRVDPAVFHAVLTRANRGEHVRYSDEQRLMANNLQSSGLTEYLRDHHDEFVCVIFSPYLFGTTYWGVQAVQDKALLLPCLHDEPSAHLAIFREMLEGVAGMLLSTQAESEMATASLGVANPCRTLVGYGFDEAAVGDGEAMAKKYSLPEMFLLYSGRLESGKNVPLLLEYFTRYQTEHPGNLALVLTGTGDVPIPQRSDIVNLGVVPEEDLPGIFASALALCQPSLNESFSIVIMESWLQGRPVLVHADCAVTHEHVARSGGGFAIDSYESFRVALRALTSDSPFADQLGQRGRRYVLSEYGWPIVIERLIRGIAAFTAPRRAADRLGQLGVQRALSFTHNRFRDALLDLVEEAIAGVSTPFQSQQRQQLRVLAHVGMPEYAVRSRLPIAGRIIAWTRRHLTSHLKEPYLDPIVQRQETFNREVLDTLLPMLERTVREQRRLQHEVETLRAKLAAISADSRTETKTTGE